MVEHNSNGTLLGQFSIGIGTWAWGDRFFWGYGQGYGENDLEAAFQAAWDAGVRFFDTAEVYGQGKSEAFLGKFLAAKAEPVVIASKFMPYPWRLDRGALARALRNSLERLKRPRLELYQIHWPFPPVTIETWMEAMAGAVQEDLVQAVGVSNYNLGQMRRAHDALARHGIPLTSNQVEYSLLNRSIERSGLLKASRDLGVRIIAYSPLAMGLLTGKYSAENPPRGMRARYAQRMRMKDLGALIQRLRQIGSHHGDKTPAQVALNWTIAKGTIPIPGAKTASQALQNLGAVGWQLDESEVAELDELSDRVVPAR